MENFKIIALYLLIMFIQIKSLEASSQDKCLGEHIVEGQFLMTDDKKLVIMLNKGTHKEIIVRVEKYDIPSYRCAAEGCSGEVKLKFVKKERFPREYKASVARFIREVKSQNLKNFSSCGYN